MATQIVIVEFVKSGGQVGLTEKMIISNNGHAILSRSQGEKESEFDLAASSLEELRNALETSRIDEFNGQEFPLQRL